MNSNDKSKSPTRSHCWQKVRLWYKELIRRIWRFFQTKSTPTTCWTKMRSARPSSSRGFQEFAITSIASALAAAFAGKVRRLKELSFGTAKFLLKPYADEPKKENNNQQSLIILFLLLFLSSSSSSLCHCFISTMNTYQRISGAPTQVSLLSLTLRNGSFPSEELPDSVERRRQKTISLFALLTGSLSLKPFHSVGHHRSQVIPRLEVFLRNFGEKLPVWSQSNSAVLPAASEEDLVESLRN